MKIDGNEAIKRGEMLHFDKLGLDYEVRWVNHPRFRSHYKRITDQIKSIIEPQENIRMLDIGCGTGRGYSFFLDGDITIAGADISRKLLLAGKEKLRNLEFRENVDLVQADADFLPFENNTFDVVTFWGTLHHLPDKERALIEAERCLKENGLISIHEPNADGNKTVWKIGRILDLPSLLLKRSNPADNENMRLSNSDISESEEPMRYVDLISLLRKRGFQILIKKTVWYLGIIPLSYPPKLNKIYYRIANAIDGRIERRSESIKGGAIFIVARKIT